VTSHRPSSVSGVPGGWGGSNHPEIPKALQNHTKLNLMWKLSKIVEFRTPTPPDVQKKGSKILNLPSVSNCFTLAMTNKLVVIINCLKVPKIKKILLFEMKFLVPNYTCLQNPWLGGYGPHIPDLSVLCPRVNLLNPPPPKKQNSWVCPCHLSINTGAHQSQHHTPYKPSRSYTHK